MVVFCVFYKELLIGIFLSRQSAEEHARKEKLDIMKQISEAHGDKKDYEPEEIRVETWNVQ